MGVLHCCQATTEGNAKPSSQQFETAKNYFVQGLENLKKAAGIEQQKPNNNNTSTDKKEEPLEHATKQANDTEFRDNAELMVVDALCNLGRLHLATKSYGDVENLIQEALGIAEGALGGEHRKIAICLSILAKYYADTSQQLYAEGLFNKALALYQHHAHRTRAGSQATTVQPVVLQNDPHFREAALNYASYLRRLGRHKQAAHMLASYGLQPADATSDALTSAAAAIVPIRGFNVLWWGTFENFSQ